ncbi:hypothetical protein MMC17_000135 [Xylographa soralifera]|nr:hypothetical protein [Xylographa soralifera]
MDDLVAQPSASGGSSAKSKKKKNRKTRTIKSNSMTNEVFEHKVSPGTAIDLALPAGAIQDLPNNVLREAVVNGDADLTKKALEMEGANPNATTTDPSCVPMLSLATDARHDQVVKLLIDAGADVNQGSGDKSKALHRAAKHNRRGILQALLENGVSVNETDNLGRTALSYAAEEGHTDAVRLLLNADVDPNSEDFDKRTPLHWAALKGHVVIVSLLTAAGARKPHKDISGLTAETLAREAGKYTVARLLSSTTPPLDRGQNISAAATSAALPLSSEVSKKLRLNDLKKFSENFKLLTSVPKDLIPILLNDRSKQEEIDRLNKRKDWKTGMPLAQYDTKPWVHNPKLNTSVQPLPKTKNHSKQFQRLPEDPAIVRVRLPPSSGDRSEEMVHVPHNQRRLESNVAAVRPEDGIVSPSGYSPPVRVTWSQIASRGTVHDVHRAAK